MSFFGLGVLDKPLVHSEIFTLCYYGQGGFTHDQAYNMPIYLRRFYLKSIQQQVEKENVELNKIKQGNTSGISSPPNFKKK